MEEHLNKRPKKIPFEKEKIEKLRNKVVEKIKADLLPDDGIIQILLIGSSVKNSFGKYELPGFRGSLYSDFDFIIFVENDYKIPKWLEKELGGKPFSDDSLNLAYRNKKYIDNKYDIEILFIRYRSFQDPKIQELGELAGIPMTNNTDHINLIVYKKNKSI